MADIAHDASGPASPKSGDIAPQQASRPDSPDRGKLRVFISYSRDDLDFADQLDAALDLCGFECSIDRHGISGGEDWKRRLGTLISEADTVVFVLSPASARSEICAWEVEEATRLSKRILPVICRPLDGASPPPRLRDRNYIFFYADPKTPGSGFGTGLASLVAALNTDFDWLREHTRYLQRAIEWDRGGRPANRLLSGDDIASAKAWAARRPKDAPEPTELHLDFVRASENFETERQSEERRRLEEREKLVHEAERATAERAAAQQRETAAARRLVQRTLLGGMAALVLALVAGAVGVYAVREQGEAEIRKVQAVTEAARAETAAKDAAAAKEQAIKTRDAAVLAQSQYLADLSLRETEEGNNPVNGILLALEALPDKDSDDPLQRGRTFWPPAEMSLELAWRATRERQVIGSGDETLLAVAPNGSYLALSTPDGMLRIREIGTFKEFTSLANGSLVTGAMFTADSARIVSGAKDGAARLWDLASGRALITLKADNKEITSVKISSNGARLVTVSGYDQVRIWDVTAQRQIAMLQGLEGSSISSGRVTLDGSRVITGGWGTSARVWDIETGRELSAVNVPGGAYTVALTPDGKHLITGGGSNLAAVWDLVSGRELMEFRGHTSAVHSLAVTPDGERLISGSDDGTARVWDVESGRELLVLKGHTGLYARITDIWVTSDGNRVITNSWDGTTRVWDLAAKGSEPLVLTGHFGEVMSNVASSDGHLLVTASVDKTARVWEAATGREITTLTHPETVTIAVFTPDGGRVVTGSTDGIVRIWDLETGRVINTLEGHSGAIKAVAITPDGSRIVTGGQDATARVWDARSGRVINIFAEHTGSVASIVVTPDGTRVLTGSTDQTIRVWDLASGNQQRVLTGHVNSVLALAVTSDSRLVVSGSADYTLRVWDIDTGRDLHIPMAHASAVDDIALTPDGKRIVSSSADGTMRIWELSSGALLANLNWHGAELRSMALTPDGARLLTASKDGSARVWELFPARGDVESAKVAAPRCLTPAERKRFHLAPAPPAWCARLQKWPYNRTGILMTKVLIDRGDRDEADIIIAAVSAVDPTLTNAVRARSYNIKAWNELISRRPANGLADAEQAVALAPNDAGIIDTRGQIYNALGHWAEAIADLDKAIAGGVSGASTFTARGYAHEASGNRDAAIADYRMALTQPANDDHEKRAHAAAREHLVALGVQIEEDTRQ
jgi:WD40 repeat protein